MSSLLILGRIKKGEGQSRVCRHDQRCSGCPSISTARGSWLPQVSRGGGRKREESRTGQQAALGTTLPRQTHLLMGSLGWASAPEGNGEAGETTQSLKCLPCRPEFNRHNPWKKSCSGGSHLCVLFLCLFL